MATIGLAMIAKDEAPVIERALDSVLPLVDYAWIQDTGSTDGTQEIVRDWLGRNKVAGVVHEEPWRDFAHNRSVALASLREIEHVDFALILDCDDTLVIHGDPKEIKESLTADCYTIDIHHGAITHQRPHIIRNKKPFRYRGVVHEFLECREENTRGHLDSLSIKIIGGGVHSRDDSAMRRDAETLEKALQDPNRERDLDARYTFYLAQSWRDCGEWEKSLDCYLERAKQGGWGEEVYCSLLNAARIKEKLNRPLTDTAATYSHAYQVNPKRAEAIHGVARLFRLANIFYEGYATARQGIALPVYRGLFVEEWVYNYGLLDEFAINAYYAQEYVESYLASDLILKRCGDQLDATNRKRIEDNREFARSKL